MNFLAIDDDELAVEVLKTFLADIGHEDVKTIPDARTALDHLDRIHGPRATECVYDTIFVDIHMPGMDGVEFCAELRRKPYGLNVPIICVTTDTARDYVTRALAAGATDYVAKPFDPLDLASRISAASAILNEQRRLLDRYIRATTADADQAVTENTFDLLFRVPDLERMVHHRALENYLLAVDEEAAAETIALAFRIDDATLERESENIDRFLRLNRRVARKFAKNLDADGALFAYVGRGTFVVVAKRSDAKKVRRTIRFSSKRFSQEKAYPELFLVHSGVVRYKPGTGGGAERLLVEALSELDTGRGHVPSDPTMKVIELPRRKPRFGLRSWRDWFQSRAPEETSAPSLDHVRETFLQRLERDLPGMREAIDSLHAGEAAQPAIERMSDHAHRTANLAKTVGLWSLGEVAGRLDGRLRALKADGSAVEIDKQLLSELEQFVELCAKVSADRHNKMESA